MTDKDTIIRDTVVAVTRLLLGQRKLKRGVSVVGGPALNIVGRANLARIAVTSDTDLVHLGFGHDADGRYGLTSITLMCPRDGVCHGKTDCTLWVSKAGSRAIILPQSGHRGSFRMTPREIVQLPDRPQDEADGAARGRTALAKLLNTQPASPETFEVYPLHQRTAPHGNVAGRTA